MKNRTTWVRDTALTIVILLLCFGVSLLMQDVVGIPEQVTTAFAFAVFLISLLTDGYFYGLAAAMISVLLVNYAFTFPYFALNFIIPSNFFSALVMAFIAVMTSTLTTKIKHQEAMKAEAERERMRANLLRAVSHDLRTPLTTIYGSSTALRENSDTLTPQQKDKMLLGIQEDAQWLVQMVENLLSITRIDSGSVKLTLVSTALDELIDSVIINFRKRYPRQKVLLDLPQQLVMIPMDPMLIGQVLINILENAARHGENPTWIQLKVTAQDGVAHFSIADNGCGIADDRLPYLFTGGYTNDEKPADHKKGNAGIGLMVCATIIHAHGGQLTARNRPEGGAEFLFTLKTEDTEDE